MSETRPPMTAGPIERALRFWKSTSVNCGAPEDGAGVTEADSVGVVLSGEAAVRGPAPAGEEAGGDSSCAKQIEARIRPDMTTSRVLIIGKEMKAICALGASASLLLRRRKCGYCRSYDAGRAGRKGRSCLWCRKQAQYRVGDRASVGECRRAAHFQLPRRAAEGKRGGTRGHVRRENAAFSMRRFKRRRDQNLF